MGVKPMSMLIGKTCKVGNRHNHGVKDFKFYEGIIASEAILQNEDEVGLLILYKGRLIITDIYYIYDIEELNQ